MLGASVPLRTCVRHRRICIRSKPATRHSPNLVVRHAGISCELQLSTELMLQAKATTGHRDYEVIRELKAATVAGDLGRVRARYHD